MPDTKTIKKRAIIEVPQPKKVSFSNEIKNFENSNENLNYNDGHDHNKITASEYPSKLKKCSPQQKTLRLEEDLFQAVKIVSKSLGMTEQDFIVSAIKKETNVHLATAKERLTAQIANLPSVL